MDKVTRKFIDTHSECDPYQSAWTPTGFTFLRTYLQRAKKGNSKVYTAPFYGKRDIRSVMESWNDTLKSVKAQWPSLYEFEIDLANKVGPMSIQKPTLDRIEDIEHYYKDILRPSSPISRIAINEVMDEFSSLRGLRLRSPRRTVERMKLSTSSGSPWFTRKNKVMGKILPNTVWNDTSDWFDECYARIQQHTWSQPAVLGWRGQEGGMSADDVKQRVVWMFPFAVNLAELRCYQPLISGAQERGIVPSWVSNDMVDEWITRLFDTKKDGDLVVCTDFSRFDQHFNRDLQNAARSILQYILTDDVDEIEWLENVFPIKYSIQLAWDTGVASKYRARQPWKSVSYFRGDHGMASGSGGTNVDETLAHRALQHEVAISHDQQLNPYSMCLGDDGVLTYPGIRVQDVVEAYNLHGQECNPAKQYASSQSCVYLRRWHHAEYRPEGLCAGVYSTMRAIGRLRYLERYMNPQYWNPEMVALRQLSIIENCKWHPLFEQFVQFCMKGDQYRLGIDLPGFLDNITSKAKEAATHMPDFLGYTKTLQGEDGSGIAQWRVVRYLKSLRG